METFRTIAILGLLIVVLTACGSNPPYRLGPIGGPGANSFDEYSEGSIPANAELTSVHAPIVPPGQEVCGHPGTRPVHYIQSGYSPPSGSKGPKHGGGFVCTALHIFTPPSPLPTISLKPGEFLTGIFGRAGEFVDRIEFITNKSGFSSFDEIEQRANQINASGNPFFLLAPPGYKIRHWFGRSGAAIDAIGIRAEEEPTLPKTGFQWYKLGAVGGWGGTAFEDPLVSASVRVTKIRVTAGCYVYRVKFEYSSGAKQTDHGGSGPSLCPLSWVGPIAEEQSFDLDQDEFIRGINGRSGRYIDQLEFVTNKRTIGPFGGDGGEPFYMIAPPDFKVKRLFGRSGAFIDGLGIIVEK